MDIKDILQVVAVMDAINKQNKEQNSSLDSLLGIVAPKKEEKNINNELATLLELTTSKKEDKNVNKDIEGLLGLLTTKKEENKQSSDITELIKLLKEQADAKSKEPSLSDILTQLTGKNEEPKSIGINDYLKGTLINTDGKQKDQLSQLVDEINKLKQEKLNMQVDTLVNDAIRTSGLPYDIAVKLVNRDALRINPDTNAIEGLTEQLDAMKGLVQGGQSAGINFGITPSELHVDNNVGGNKNLASNVLIGLGLKQPETK